MMRYKVNSMTARRSSANTKPAPATLATCLLCRVLWPIVVQHRHLLFNYTVEVKISRAHNQATWAR
jgi:hypothetical protein